jgi:DNA repair protein RecO (recombination protein O)
MPAPQRALAIVVGGFDYGEADRIVTFLTRERGRLKGIARSAKRSRKRFGAALELLCKVQLRFVERPGAELARLEGCDLVDAYPGLRSDLRRLAAATYAAEVAREAAREREAAPALFDLLDQFLARLACQPFDLGLVRVFELRALTLLGWRPELERCAHCGGLLPDDRPLLFVAERGGLLCPGCGAKAQGSLVSPGTRKTLEAARRGERVVFTRAAWRESEAPVAEFLEHHLGKRLRSRSFLDAVGT